MHFFVYFLDSLGDLWGPLLIGLLLSTILSLTAPGDSASLVFATVFVIVWLGAAVVTVNAQLLGGTISFFQSLCILGYCVFPLTLAAFASLIMKLIWRPVREILLSVVTSPDTKTAYLVFDFIYYMLFCKIIIVHPSALFYFVVLVEIFDDLCGLCMEHPSIRSVLQASNQGGTQSTGSVSSLLVLHFPCLDDSTPVIVLCCAT